MRQERPSLFSRHVGGADLAAQHTNNHTVENLTVVGLQRNMYACLVLNNWLFKILKAQHKKTASTISVICAFWHLGEVSILSPMGVSA